MLAAPQAVRGAPATGQTAAQRKARARKLFEKGELYYQQGEFKKALGFYMKANRTFRHPAFVFNVAQCHRLLEHYRKALFFYRLFLSERPNASNAEEVRKRIGQMEKKLKEQKARLQAVGRVSIISRPQGAAVRVDRFTGPAAGTTPVILKLKAGEHLVLLDKPGFEKLHRTVRVKAGGVAVLTVELRASQDARVAPRPREARRASPGGGALSRARHPGGRGAGLTPGPAPRGSKVTYRPFWRRWWFWVGTVVSVAAISLGATAGGFALRDYNRYLGNGDVDVQRSAKRTAAAADGLLFGGAALGVATIVGAIIVHARYKKAANERASVLQVAPSCSARGCGLQVRGRF